MRGFVESVRSMTTITGWLFNIWPLFMLLVVDDIAAAYVSAPMWMTQGEWEWALKVVGPALMYFALLFTFFLLKTSNVIPKASLWVRKVLTIIQIYTLSGHWSVFYGLAASIGFGGPKVVYAAIFAKVSGGQILAVATLITLIMVALELWDMMGKIQFLGQRKDMWEQRFWNWVNGGKKFTESGTGTHGTASWMKMGDFLSKMIPPEKVKGLLRVRGISESEKVEAVPIGVTSVNPKTFEDSKVIWAPADKHILVQAGARGGKGISVIVPTCLEYRGSLVVFDPQDENREMTARYRSEVLGQDIYWIKPTDPEKERRLENHHTHGINPLRDLHPERSDFMARVKEIATLLVKEGSGSGGQEGSSAYFVNNAVELMAAMIASEIAGRHVEGQTPTTLREVYQLLSLPGDSIQQIIFDKFISVPNGYYGKYHGGIVQLGAGFYDMANDTWTSITTSIKAACGWLADDKYARLVSSNTIDPAKIIDGKTTIYINLTMDEFRQYPALAKVIVSALFQGQISNPGHGKKVLYILDEMVQLGKADFIHIDAVQGHLKHGIVLMGIIQSMKTMGEVLGKASVNAWMGSSGIRMMSAIGDEEDAAAVSRLLGKTTAVSYSNRGQGRNNIASGSVSGEADSYSETARDLMTADEVMNLPNNEWIVSLRNEKPIRIGKLAYVLDKKFSQHPFLKGKGDPNRLIFTDFVPTMPIASERSSILSKEPDLYQPLQAIDIMKIGQPDDDPRLVP